MNDKFYVSVSESIRKDLGRIPQPWQHRIIDAMYSLETNPFIYPKMEGKLKDVRKVVVWPYRILFAVDKQTKVIKILEVGHRGGMSYK